MPTPDSQRPPRTKLAQVQRHLAVILGYLDAGHPVPWNVREAARECLGLPAPLRADHYMGGPTVGRRR